MILRISNLKFRILNPEWQIKNPEYQILTNFLTNQRFDEITRNNQNKTDFDWLKVRN